MFSNRISHHCSHTLRAVSPESRDEVYGTELPHDTLVPDRLVQRHIAYIWCEVHMLRRLSYSPWGIYRGTRMLSSYSACSLGAWAWRATLTVLSKGEPSLLSVESKVRQIITWYAQFACITLMSARFKVNGIHFFLENWEYVTAWHWMSRYHIPYSGQVCCFTPSIKPYWRSKHQGLGSSLQLTGSKDSGLSLTADTWSSNVKRDLIWYARQHFLLF